MNEIPLTLITCLVVQNSFSSLSFYAGGVWYGIHQSMVFHLYSDLIFFIFFYCESECEMTTQEVRKGIDGNGEEEGDEKQKHEGVQTMVWTVVCGGVSNNDEHQISRSTATSQLCHAYLTLINNHHPHPFKIRIQHHYYRI